MKKVMHLISTSIFSGAENVACQIINSFKDSNEYEMVYCSVIGKNKKSLEERNIVTYPIKNFDIYNLKKAINKYKPDIIHAHDPKACVMAAIVSKNEKIIAHVHCNHESMRVKSLKSIIFNFFNKKYNRIIWVSDSSLEGYIYKNKIINKSIVLYNTINSKEILEKANSDPNTYSYDIIYLGRLTYQKNPQRLLKIIKKITEVNSKIRVVLIGTGEYENEVKELIRKYNLENNIDFLGFVANPYKILLSSKVMLMTSRAEGTPMCALEGITCGIPIVSTKVDGLKKIIKDNLTGYLSDDDDVIVEKVNYLLANNDQYNLMKREIIKYSKFVNDFDEYIKKIHEIYGGGNLH